MDLLPEIWAHTFSFMTIPEKITAARTCRKWKEIIYQLLGKEDFNMPIPEDPCGITRRYYDGGYFASLRIDDKRKRKSPTQDNVVQTLKSILTAYGKENLSIRDTLFSYNIELSFCMKPFTRFELLHDLSMVVDMGHRNRIVSIHRSNKYEIYRILYTIDKIIDIHQECVAHAKKTKR